jgi:putative ABC transport system ATP-binding protein
MQDEYIKVDRIYKSFDTLESKVNVLNGISFTVAKGDFVVIIGPSGCGKSTLLHVMLGLEAPTAGTIFMNGNDIFKDFDPDRLTDYRKSNVGMVFQQSNWVQALNVAENVAFPLILQGKTKAEALDRSNVMLDMVGMKPWDYYNPMELSSGQQQKVALARALITDPDIIYADEPTGNLDYTGGQATVELLRSLSDQGKTVIMVTHNRDYIKYAKTEISIFEGKVNLINRVENGKKLE